jgi:hypothetical protein
MKIYCFHRLKSISSPIQIRHTIRRVRACPNTSTIIFQLLWPFSWYFPLPEPLSYEELQAAPEIIDTRQCGIRNQFEIPLFRVRDTPLRSLYRLYDDMCAGRLTLMTYESEYLFRRGSKRWLLVQIPDPQDTDPTRYAILASLVEALVDVFNWRLELGIRRGGRPCDQSEERATNFTREEAPPWTQNIAGVEKQVNLIDRKSEPFAKSDENFLRRNIVATSGYLYII